MEEVRVGEVCQFVRTPNNVKRVMVRDGICGESAKSGTHRRAFLYGFKENITVKHTLVMGGKMKN